MNPLSRTIRYGGLLLYSAASLVGEVSTSVPVVRRISDSIAEIAFKDSVKTLQTVRIYEGTDPSNSVVRTYFYAPLFAIIPSVTPNEKLPIFSKVKTSDGPVSGVATTIHLQLADNKLAEVARGAVLARRDLPWMTQPAGGPNVPNPEDRIRIDVTTIHNLSCEVRLMGSSKPLGSGMYTEVGRHADVEMELFFSSEAWQKVLSAEAKDLLFTYTYTYAAEGSSPTTVTGTSTHSLEKLANSIIDAQQIKDGPILQKDADELRSRLVETTKLSIRGFDPAMVGKMNLGEFLNPLMREATLDLAKPDAASEEVKKKLAGYLQPLVNDIKSTRETKESTTDSRTTEKGGEGGGGLFDVIVGAAGPALGVSGLGSAILGDKMTSKEIERLEKTSGIQFTQTANTQAYTPSSAKVYFLNKNWAETTRNLFAVIETLSSVAAVATEHPIPGTFTSEIANTTLQLQKELAAYEGVRLGMILPYIGPGQFPPKGYVWADGNTRWPRSSWVPEVLRGQPVPKLDNVLIGATTDDPSSLKAGQEDMMFKRDGSLGAISLASDLQWHPEASLLTLTPEAARPKLGPKVDFPEAKAVELAQPSFASYTSYVFSLQRAVGNTPGKVTGTISFPKEHMGYEQAPPNFRVRWIIRVE